MQGAVRRPRLRKRQRGHELLSGDDVKTGTRMNKTLIFEELKQIAIREIHTHPGWEDVFAVGICHR